MSVDSISCSSFYTNKKICNTDSECCITSENCINSQHQKQFPPTPILEDWEAENNTANFNQNKSNPFILINKNSSKPASSSIKETIKKNSVCTQKTKNMEKLSSIITPSFSSTMLNTNNMIRF